MTNHWLLRVGDGVHFTRSQRYMCWGVNSKHVWVRNFLSNVRPGDVLWFIKSKTQGTAIGVATYTEHKLRILGPLIALTPTNEDFGWTNVEGSWDVEVHYQDLYNIEDIGIHTRIKSPLVIRLFKYDKVCVDLPAEHANIIRYSHAKKFVVKTDLKRPGQTGSS